MSRAIPSFIVSIAGVSIIAGCPQGAMYGGSLDGNWVLVASYGIASTNISDPSFDDIFDDPPIDDIFACLEIRGEAIISWVDDCQASSRTITTSSPAVKMEYGYTWILDADGVRWTIKVWPHDNGSLTGLMSGAGNGSSYYFSSVAMSRN